MRSRWNAVWMAVLLMGWASAGFAQDVDPETGEGGEADVDLDETAPADAGDKPISLGLLLGYGISFEDGPNLWSLGFGLRGGYNLDQIFLGGRFVYYLGASEGSGITEITMNIWELGVEVGYDLAAGPAIIRPEFGLGIANFSIDTTFEDSEAYLQVAFGASALFDVTDSVFVGADARLAIVLGDDTYKGLLLLANGGMRF